MNEIKVVDGQLALPTQMNEVLKKLQEFQVTKQEMANEEELIREQIMHAMEEHNVKSLETPYGTFTYVAESMTTRVDTKRLKEEGLYDIYSKPSKRKASVRITYND